MALAARQICRQLHVQSPEIALVAEDRATSVQAQI